MPEDPLLLQVEEKLHVAKCQQRCRCDLTSGGLCLQRLTLEQKRTVRRDHLLMLALSDSRCSPPWSHVKSRVETWPCVLVANLCRMTWRRRERGKREKRT